MKYYVEFWAHKIGDRIPGKEDKLTVDRSSEEEAIKLEKRFHELGIPARAVSVEERVSFLS